MTAFNDVFYSLFSSKIQNLSQNWPNLHWELTIKKNFKLRISEFNKIRHFEITKQKLPLPDSSPGGEGVFRVGRGTPLPTLHRLQCFVPNFELALTPLRNWDDVAWYSGSIGMVKRCRRGQLDTTTCRRRAAVGSLWWRSPLSRQQPASGRLVAPRTEATQTRTSQSRLHERSHNWTVTIYFCFCCHLCVYLKETWYYMYRLHCMLPL